MKGKTRSVRSLGAEDRVLGGLGHAELHDLLGGDLDLGARGRIAADAGLAVHQNQLANAREGEGVLGVLVSDAQQSVD